MTLVEKVARFLCELSGFDPNRKGKQVGDCGVLYRHGDQNKYGWEEFVEDAKAIIKLVEGATNDV